MLGCMLMFSWHVLGPAGVQPSTYCACLVISRDFVSDVGPLGSGVRECRGCHPCCCLGIHCRSNVRSESRGHSIFVIVCLHISHNILTLMVALISFTCICWMAIYLNLTSLACVFTHSPCMQLSVWICLASLVCLLICLACEYLFMLVGMSSSSFFASITSANCPYFVIIVAANVYRAPQPFVMCSALCRGCDLILRPESSLCHSSAVSSLC